MQKSGISTDKHTTTLFIQDSKRSIIITVQEYIPAMQKHSWRVLGKDSEGCSLGTRHGMENLSGQL